MKNCTQLTAETEVFTRCQRGEPHVHVASQKPPHTPHRPSTRLAVFLVLRLQFIRALNLTFIDEIIRVQYDFDPYDFLMLTT